MAVRKSTEERRKEITDAAIRIIGERGLREFTAAKLAHEVGIRDGTIFRHFRNMNAIILAVFARLQELIETAPGTAEDPLKRLEIFVMNRLHSAAVRPGIQSLIFSDQIAHILGAEGQRQAAALRNRGREFVRACLCEASAKGLIRKDFDIEGGVLLITGMVMGFLFAVKDNALSMSVAEIERKSWRTLRSILEREQVTS